MSSYLSDLDHHKINAQVNPWQVVETHYISDPSNGHRKVPRVKLWKVERVLGKGGCAEVRLETNREDDEKRAVKRMWTSGSTLKKEYRRELMALLEFSKPKYKEAAVFVEFLGWFEDHECVYLAMEYIPLGDLEHNVPARARAITEGEVRDITCQVLEGLRIMHLEGFVHRDLKPKNILVCRGSPNWWVKLTDFGLSKQRTDETAYRTMTGTYTYMAPEVLKFVPRIDPTGDEYTNAIDLWALGCVVYRLARGVVPFPPGPGPSLGLYCENQSELPFHEIQFTNLGLDLLRGLLMPYPWLRFTAQEALEHPWMTMTFNALGRIDANRDQEKKAYVHSDFMANTGTHPGLNFLKSEEPTFTAATPGLYSTQTPAFSSREGIVSGYLAQQPAYSNATPKKSFSDGVTQEQRAELNLFLDVPTWENPGPNEIRRWGGMWQDPLRPATSVPDLQQQARRGGAARLDGRPKINSKVHSRNMSTPKPGNVSDQILALYSQANAACLLHHPLFASRILALQDNPPPPASKSTKRSAKRKKSQQMRQTQFVHPDKKQESAAEAVSQETSVMQSGTQELQSRLANQMDEPIASQSGKEPPQFSLHVMDMSTVPTPSSHNVPPANTTSNDSPSRKINDIRHGSNPPAIDDSYNKAKEPFFSSMTSIQTRSTGRNSKKWSSVVPKIEEDVTSAFKAFALEQRRIASDQRRIMKSTVFNDLVAFSSSFNLSTPIPKDLVPVLTNDPDKQKQLEKGATRVGLDTLQV